MKKAVCEGMDRNKTTEMLRILLRVLAAVLFAACVLFIWHNSMESAEVSAERSGRVTGLVNQVLESVGRESVTEHFVRKLAHFSEYGLEGALTVLLFAAYCLKPGKYFLREILTGLFTAAVDESIQFFSAGRAPGILDVCIDMAGFLCGMLFASAVYWMINRRFLSGACRLQKEEAHFSR